MVVGAGAVGLAIARALALSGREVLVLEQAARLGTGVSARSSEVIHGGLYYPPGSLKAALCIAGRRRLYPFLEARGVGFRRCGKLVVAADAEELDALDSLQALAEANGVEGLARLSRRQALALEPALACEGALLSPETGVFDSHGYMLSLLGEAQAHGAQLVCGVTVASLSPLGGGWRVEAVTNADGARIALAARTVINAAGLGAQTLAAATEGLDPARVPRLHLARGAYFSVSGRAPFQRLIYPVPVPGGLGVHLTLDLAGQARFGPDVAWIDALDYTVDPARGPAFADAVRRYWPALDPDRLAPAYAGVRPKLSGPGEPAADFRVSGPADHGLAGLVNLFGIESPGLTASLALADHALGELDAA